MRIEVRSYDHPDSARLIDEVQQEYVIRYGSRDDTPVDPAEFTPPQGLFLVGYVERDGVEEPAVTGGWRSHGADAEMKRMYVTPDLRGRGLARAMLVELERTAREAGHRRMILETGAKQPEAVQLYTCSGYTPVERFGHYADAPLAIHLGKSLLAEEQVGEDALPSA